MTEVILKLAVVVSLATSVTWAQSHVLGTIEWEPQHRKFACDSSVVVQASLSPNAADELIVGLEGAPEAAGVELALGSVVPVAAHPTPTRRVFTNRSTAIRQTAPCLFEFSAEPPGRERLALHVRVKPNTRVTLLVNGETSASLVVTRGVLLHNGRIIADAGALYVLRAAAAGVTRGFFKDAPELVRDPRGLHIITATGFRNHLIETPGLKFASRSRQEDGCCAGATLVTFKVGVAPSGEVVSVEPLHVPPQLAQKLTRLLEELRLKPFEQDGVGVYAEGFLTLLLDRTGRVWYPY